MRRALVTVLALFVLAGCTDIPTSSDPERIESLPAGNAAAVPSASPVNGASPFQIVTQFLDLNSSVERDPSAALQFLTPQYRARWRATTSKVTVLAQSPNISDYRGTAKDGEVIVSGSVVGTVGSTGVYTPSLLGSGTGGSTVPFVFKIKSVKGQYRIDKLPDGLLLGLSDFDFAYQTYPLYFFQSGGPFLVPDLRTTSLTGRLLQNWLLRQLVAGPRSSLVDAVDADTFPAPQSSTRVSVSGGTTLRIDVPGASSLDSQGRDRLGAQVARTLDRAVPPSTIMSITDGAVPVAIPETGASQFVAAQFSSVTPTPPTADVYYLLNGRVTTAAGRQVAGKLAGAPALQSLAVARRSPGNALLVAGGAGSRLYLGDATDGLEATDLTGLTSRPSWAPGLREVWVGVGTALYRVDDDGTPQPIEIVSPPAGSQIVAVRLSPEGSRVALVFQSASGAQQLFVGSVVRGLGQVRVNGLEPLSPAAVGVIDASWIDATGLFAIGYDAQIGPTFQNSEIIEVKVDGSAWGTRGISNLPGGPDFATIVPRHVAWVSANGAVWEQAGRQWQSPGPGMPRQNGEAPVYLE